MVRSRCPSTCSVCVNDDQLQEVDKALHWAVAPGRRHAPRLPIGPQDSSKRIGYEMGIERVSAAILGANCLFVVLALVRHRMQIRAVCADIATFYLKTFRAPARFRRQSHGSELSDLQIAARAHSLMQEWQHSFTLFALPFHAVLRNASRITSITDMNSYGCARNNGILYIQDSFCLLTSLMLVLGPWRSSRRAVQATLVLHLAWHISDIGMQGNHRLTEDGRVYQEFALRFALAACCPCLLALIVNAGLSILWCGLCYFMWGFETHLVFALAVCSTVVDRQWFAYFAELLTSTQRVLRFYNFDEYSLLGVYQFSDKPQEASLSLFVVDETIVFVLMTAALSAWHWLLWTLSLAHVRLHSSEGIRCALLGTLDCLCDCVVQLDSTLSLAKPSPKLASLLLSSAIDHLCGEEFRRFTASAPDAALLDAALARASAAQVGAPVVSSFSELISLRDSYGAELRIQMIPTHYEDAGGNSCYIIGMNELNQRSAGVPPIGMDHPVPQDVVSKMAYSDRSHSSRSSSPNSASEKGDNIVEITFPRDWEGMAFECLHDPPHKVLRVDPEIKSLLGQDQVSQANALGLTAWLSEEDTEAVSTWLEVVIDRIKREEVELPFSAHFGLVASMLFMTRAREIGSGLAFPWLRFTFLPNQGIVGDDADVQAKLSKTVFCEIFNCPSLSVESQFKVKTALFSSERRRALRAEAKKPRKSRSSSSKRSGNTEEAAGGTPASVERCELDANVFGRAHI